VALLVLPVCGLPALALLCADPFLPVIAAFRCARRRKRTWMRISRC
jgi:hypothetical protein